MTLKAMLQELATAVAKEEHHDREATDPQEVDTPQRDVSQEWEQVVNYAEQLDAKREAIRDAANRIKNAMHASPRDVELIEKEWEHLFSLTIQSRNAAPK